MTLLASSFLPPACLINMYIQGEREGLGWCCDTILLFVAKPTQTKQKCFQNIGEFNTPLQTIGNVLISS